jgi:hypothetical protein
MNWFSRTTSIAGIQVSNLDDARFSGCRRNLDYLLIRRPPLKHAANSSAVQGGGSGVRAQRLIEQSAICWASDNLR